MLQIHQKIEQARISAGLSQEELAEKIGIKRSTYQYWEEKPPSIANVHRVEKALGLMQGSLLNDESIVQEKESVSRDLLEKSIHNLTETNWLNARNIERLITLLEVNLNAPQKAPLRQNQIGTTGNHPAPKSENLPLRSRGSQEKEKKKDSPGSSGN